MVTLFIADLHLDPQRPHATDAFIQLMQRAQRVAALYILGDLVEYWLGDDDQQHGLDIAFDALAAVSNAKVPVFFMPGNRDFLLGQQWAERYGVTMLPEPSVIDLYGTTTLLLHGDTLCTDDTAYQEFRQQVRDPAWQRAFLAKPLDERRAIANHLRKTSQQAMQGKSAEIMDVNQTTVMNVMREYQVTQLIHGHTHRPNIHEFLLDRKHAKRIVLGDWYQDQATALEVSADNAQLVTY